MLFSAGNSPAESRISAVFQGLLCLVFLAMTGAAPASAQQQSAQQNIAGQAETDRLISALMAMDQRAVRLIQSRLADMGYYAGPASGVADERTFAAILRFHQDHPGPVDKLESRVRDTVSERGETVIGDGGVLDLRVNEPVHQKPLCLDLPGRNDCAGGGK